MTTTGSNARGNTRSPNSDSALDELWSEIQESMGICPSFFKLASPAPAIAYGFFELAKLAYLENPIPAAFKERLFPYLSRFCPIRYCMIRHAAFLAGHGHVAGDATVPPLPPAEIASLVDEPLPCEEELERSYLEIKQLKGLLAEWPQYESCIGRLLKTLPRRSSFFHPTPLTGSVSSAAYYPLSSTNTLWCFLLLSGPLTSGLRFVLIVSWSLTCTRFLRNTHYLRNRT